ncbi:MAG TPA: ABC transporter permease, partial [Anaerolineaceae bacterium]|nr:ABC transporter permease [Anaerolineaceae bacterium]
FNLFQLARQMAILTVISLGMTFVISSGEIDISVGAIYNLSAVTMALLISQAGFTPWTAMLVAVLIGIIAGAINGIISVYLKLPTLIVTLGTVSLYKGITSTICKGLSIGNLPDNFFYLIGSGRLGPIPYLAIVAVIVVFVAHFIYKNTVFSRELLSIGSNHKAAERTGISINRRKIEVMAFMGLMCGIAAVMSIAYLRSSSPDSGSGYELTAIAATVVGGTPLTGGVGSILGTLVGIALITVIQNGLMLAGLPTSVQIASTGILILLAVGIQQLVRRRASSAKKAS